MKISSDANREQLITMMEKLARLQQRTTSCLEKTVASRPADLYNIIYTNIINLKVCEDVC